MGDYDYLIKFLALGDSGVGKTSFLVSKKLIFNQYFEIIRLEFHDKHYFMAYFVYAWNF